MFEIRKGHLHFIVVCDSIRVFVKPLYSTKCYSKSFLNLIRDNLMILAKYYTKNVFAENKKEALMKYFTDKGWNVKPYYSQIYTNEFGEMCIS
jgi:hypothetical protein